MIRSPLFLGHHGAYHIAFGDLFDVSQPSMDGTMYRVPDSTSLRMGREHGNHRIITSHPLAHIHRRRAHDFLFLSDMTAHTE